MMKRLFAIGLALALFPSAADAAGINWSQRTVLPGDTVTMTATGVEEGDRVAVAVFENDVFSRTEMASSAGNTAEISVNMSGSENSARAFIWEKASMQPKCSESYITSGGVMDDDAIFSDNQLVNKSTAIGYRTIAPLKGDYSLNFSLTVFNKGDNAIMLGDSSNGTLGYSTSSAILQFNGENFTTARGNGGGGYSESAVTICPVELGRIYSVIIQGSAETNWFNITLDDGTAKYESPVMLARYDATGNGIDTIAFVSNGKNTAVQDGYCSDYNFCGTNFSISEGEIDKTPLYTYDGFAGMYYAVAETGGGKYIRGNYGKITADYTSAADSSAHFLPRDMGDGSYSLVCRSSNNRITAAASGERLASTAYVSGDNTQHWLFEKTENYSAENRTYYLKSLENGLYIGVKDGYLTAVDESEKAEFLFGALKEESPMYLVSQMNVYNLLSDAQRERLESVYESVAGELFPRYGGSGYTPRERMDSLFNEILGGTLTEAEQLDKIEAFLTASSNGYIFSGQADQNHIAVSSSLPGTEGLNWAIDSGTAGTYEFWTETNLSGMLYKYTIYNADGTVQQTMDLYVEDNSTAQTNAETFKNVITSIPYEFRQYLNTVKIRNDGANYYNGGGGTLYIRINWTPTSDNMRSTVVHELGHIIDSQFGTWSGGSGWAAAMAADMYSVSAYANTTAAEDFAEFARLYFASYTNPDMQRGLKVLLPERYASFGRLRMNKLGGWGLWADEYTTYTN